MFDIFKTVFKYKEKESPDKLGLYPERVHVNAMPERRYLWTSRFLVILTCFSICINMMLALSLYVMLPQKSSTPRLFYIDRYFSQIGRMEPSAMGYPLENLITEEHITNYIMMRYTITRDYDELEKRWGKDSYLYWMSSLAVYNDFAKNEIAYNMEQFRSKNMVRNVEIDWIRNITRGVWQAQFRTLDYMGANSQPIVGIWRTTMNVAYMSQEDTPYEILLKNPFGFVITSFQQAYLGKDTAADDYLSESKKITKELFL